MAAKTDPLCPTCQHPASEHGMMGCLFIVDEGTPDADCCPCRLPERDIWPHALAVVEAERDALKASLAVARTCDDANYAALQTCQRERDALRDATPPVPSEDTRRVDWLEGECIYLTLRDGMREISCDRAAIDAARQATTGGTHG